MSLSDDLYKDIIIEHSQSPSHRGKLELANIIESGVNRSCGDEIELQLFVSDGIIRKVGVIDKGCSISTASSSMMADAIEGMTIEQAEDLIDSFKDMIVENKDVELDEDFEELKALKGVQKYPVRVKCATLAWNTLEQALKNAMKL